MNDLRVEDAEQQTPYEAPAWEPIVTGADIRQIRNIILWLSKQPWPQHEDQTWDGLVAAYEKAMLPQAAPEPHTVKVLKIGR